MAKKTDLAPKLKETTNLLKTKAEDLKESIFTISEELIEGSVETGYKVQDLLEKSLKEGNTLFAKQQDFALDTLETMFKQYKTGQGRFKQLVGIQTIKAKKKAVNTKKKLAKKTTIKRTVVKPSTSIDEMMENALKSERLSSLNNRTSTLIK